MTTEALTPLVSSELIARDPAAALDKIREYWSTERERIWEENFTSSLEDTDLRETVETLAQLAAGAVLRNFADEPDMRGVLANIGYLRDKFLSQKGIYYFDVSLRKEIVDGLRSDELSEFVQADAIDIIPQINPTPVSR